MDNAPASMQMDTRIARNLDTVIVGLGHTGLSVARFLAAQDIDFAITDTRRHPPCLDALLAELPQSHLSLGAIDGALIQGAECIVLSPGIARDDPRLRKSLKSDTELISDIELFARHVTAPVIAVTGSNGKSTVATLAAAMLKATGRKVGLGGNIGTPALALLGSREPDFHVLELSSFQLENTYSLCPMAAAVLNVSEDHMDRYTDVARYMDAKARIYCNSEFVIANADDQRVMSMVSDRRNILTFGIAPDTVADFTLAEQAGVENLAYQGTSLFPVSELRIPGRHNIANALAALALTHAATPDIDSKLQALREFSGLAHRCEWIDEIHGVDWFNDSKATNVGAACAAIAGLGPARRLVLIAGGDSKGADFSQLAQVGAKYLRHAVLLGRDAALLAKALDQLVPVVTVASLGEAVRTANILAQPGDAVLLSPACASFDMFENYEERGQAFVEAVRALQA